MGMSSSFERPAREQICVLALGAKRGRVFTGDELTVESGPSGGKNLTNLAVKIVYFLYEFPRNQEAKDASTCPGILQD